MEGIYIPGENDDDDDETSTSRGTKKQAGALGAFLVAPKKSETPAEKPKDWVEELLGKTAEKGAVTDETDDEAKVGELAELSTDETHYAEQAVVRDHAAETAADEPAAPEAAVAAAAVERFHEKILAEDKDSSQALAETLTEIESGQIEEQLAAGPDTEAEPTVAEEPPVEAPQELTEEPIVISRPETADDSDDHSSSTQSSRSATVPPSPPPTPPASPSGAVRSVAPIPIPIPVPMPRTETIVTSGGDFAAGALAGGVVGYLLGRRRGRIKTERQQQTVQTELEKRIVDLEQDIAAKEFIVRQAALEKTAGPAAKPHRTPEAATKRPEPAAPLEKIGEVLITAQAEATPHLERTSLQPIDRHIETLNKRELLELSSKIVIEGTSLRRLYEAGSINEPALRRIIVVHLRGGNIRRALRRELVTRHVDFESDPAARDSANPHATTGSPADAVLRQPTRQAADPIPTHEQRPPAASRQTVVKTAAKRRRRVQPQHLLDIIMVSTITLLLLLALLLIISRR